MLIRGNSPPANTGFCMPGTERPEAYYFKLDGTKGAVICYTYGTIYGGSGRKCLAEGDFEGTLNLLRPQTETIYMPGALRAKSWAVSSMRSLAHFPVML